MARPILIVTLLFCAAVLGSARASVPPGPPVTIVSSERSGTASIYRLHVTEAGRRAVVIVPYGAEMASLEVNGVQRERVGYDFPVGTAPLGHGTAAFSLAKRRADGSSRRARLGIA